MRIGLMVGEGSGAAAELAGVLQRGQAAEAAGLDTAWIANIALDAQTASAVLGQATNRIEIGTAVVPIYTRHPVAMVQQTASTQQACDGRFTLGIGLAHRFMVEDMWGMSYAQPAKRMRDYLEVLGPQLQGEALQRDEGPFPLKVPAPASPQPTSVLVAALGPAMLRLTGELADGTITWATGLRTLEDHIIPTINRAAAAAGRPTPRIVAGVPVLVTQHQQEALALAAEIFAIYATVPSYRAMLDREGVQGVADLAIIGDEQTVRKELQRLADAGVTDLCVFPFEVQSGEAARTLALLSELRS